MAFKSIAMKKTRSFLTMLGIIIGVASVVIMVSVLQAQNRKNLEYLEKQGDNKITVSAYSWNDVNNETGQKLFDYCLSLSDYIDGITPNIEMYQESTIQYGAKTLKTNDWSNITIGPSGREDYSTVYSLVLGSEQYGICNNYKLAGGRELSYLDIEKSNAVCVLGSNVKKALFGYTDPINETITIDGQPFLVVGYYEPIGMEYYEEWDGRIVLPYTFNRILNRNQPISDYTIKGKNVTASVEAATLIEAYLKGLFPTDENGNPMNGWYRVSNNSQQKEELESQNLMQTLVTGAIAGISLLVGGIGIMNIMLVTVTERTREIGIRKAIGAERASIIAQFLIEAAVICSIGGLIGIGAGCVGTLIAGKITLGETSMLPTPEIALGAFLFSVVLGVIFGMYPAIKASGLQPVVALRAD
jgi:putative ABC transport system permease protein